MTRLISRRGGLVETHMPVVSQAQKLHPYPTASVQLGGIGVRSTVGIGAALEYQPDWKRTSSEIRRPTTIASASDAKRGTRVGWRIVGQHRVDEITKFNIYVPTQLYEDIEQKKQKQKEHAEQQRPRRFAWAPSLLRVVRERSAEGLVREITARLWREVERQGFWPSASLRAAVEPRLALFVLNALVLLLLLQNVLCLRSQLAVACVPHAAAPRCYAPSHRHTVSI